MTTPAPPREPWDDRRLEAAFAARASSIPTPTALVAATVDRVRTAEQPAPAWRRWLPAAAVVLLAVGVAAGGIALSDQVVGRDLFRPGPTANLKTLDTGEFAFEFPASWLAYDASTSFSGGSATAVLGTLAVERRCGNERHIDINCVYEQRLEPGHIRLYVGTGTYRDGTIQDRPTSGTATRVVVGGMEANLVEDDGSPDSYYREDKSLHWEIARPGMNGTSVVELEARLKEPGVAEAREQLEALVASFRFTNGPDPSVAPTPEATPTQTPPRLSDLRVMTVAELIAATMSPTPEEVIVRGWLARSNVILDCNTEPDPHPLIPHCEEHGLFLFQDPPFVEQGSLEPRLPHVVPMLRIDAHASVPAMPGIAEEVLAIGHLLDHRWTTCPEADQAACKARFVIDRVIPADRPITDDVPEPWTSPSDRPVGDVADAVDVLSSVVGGTSVLSIGVADMQPLRSIEPQVEDINNGEGAWVIRVLVAGDTPPVPRTFLVGHIGWWTVSEVTETGVVELLGQPPSDPPTNVLGLPVMSVNDAIAIRDAGRDDREIAVRGWLPPSVPVRCVGPRPPVTSPIEPSCLTMFEVLMADKEQLATRSPDGLSAHGPAGPAISIYLNEVDQSWRPLLPTLGQASPAEIVAIGHFDDRRSNWCDATRLDACRDRFVVDRVAWADGNAQPLSVVVNDEVDRSRFESVEAVISERFSESPILSVVGYRGEGVAAIEPSLREDRPGITDQDAVWVVRVLDEGRAITYLVVDEADRVYLVETDGRTVLVGGTPAGDPERAWPPDGVLDVPLPEGDTDLTLRGGVEDRTGLLVEARAAGEADPGWPTGDLAAGEMSVVQAAPDAVVVYWNGTLCDDRFVLTVYGDRPGEPPDRLQLRGERADLCRLALVHYGMRLQFRRSVDASTIQGFDRVGTPFEAFPPVNATIVALPNDGGFSLPKVRAALVDLSGRITAVRLPRPDEPQPDAGLAGRGVLVPDASVPGRYQLAWMGGPCAPDIVIRIDSTLEHVVVTNTVPPDPPDCDTIAQLFRLILDIDGPVDPPAVEVRHADMSTGAS